MVSILSSLPGPNINNNIELITLKTAINHKFSCNMLKILLSVLLLRGIFSLLWLLYFFQSDYYREAPLISCLWFLEKNPGSFPAVFGGYSIPSGP